ncbi:immunoglobulin lambda-like polypeptide 5 isoform X2 [Sphaeramia orbicularis]|uniref:immunoglobulin lambda-like polypeptide 5 isoform X2 n=1 Tax=Sphaeramia orbicularis TaxID=375764 RepID=UPI00117EC1E9|nr:immunoglobulin lambda-like polypeptide 5 isoform X2 [Sphaeramia orbicularis]
MHKRQRQNRPVDVNMRQTHHGSGISSWFSIWTRLVHVSPRRRSTQVFVPAYFTVRGRYRYWIFGSGTKLYVTDDPVLKPVVGVYPAASTAPDGKTSLMCVASGMSPPEVRFSWKRQKDHGTEEDLPDAQGEQLEVQESGRRTSIRTIHQNHNSSDKYWCTVQHEGGTTHQEVPEVPALPPSVQPWDSQHLPCLFYSVLILKSLVYCCGLWVMNLI